MFPVLFLLPPGAAAIARAVSADYGAAPTPTARKHAMNGTLAAKQHLLGVQLSRASGDDDTTPMPFHAGASAAEMSGVQQNQTGDLEAWLSALVTNISMMIGFFVAASYLRRSYPIVYSGNVPEDISFVPSNSFFGWVYDSLFRLSTDDVVKTAGLDMGMMVEFNRFGMYLLFTLGVPLVLVVGPLHCWYGGDRSGDDHLSKWGLANVVDDHPWLYWVHALLVWLVVVTTCRHVYKAQGRFLVRRMDWLKRLPAPRATTVLVEGIPEAHRSDEKLKAYFDRMFGRKVVKFAYTVKHTETLCELNDEKDAAEQNLREAKSIFEKTGERPTVRSAISPFGTAEDSITYWSTKSDEVQKQCTAELKHVKRNAKDTVELNTESGFVTFLKRRDAELALKLAFTSDDAEFVTSTPPDPADVIYSTFQEDVHRKTVKQVIGYAMIGGMFLAYLPFVVGVTQIGDLRGLAQKIPSLRPLAESPSTVAMWDGMVGSLAMQLFVSFVPTFLVMIFCMCFKLKAEAFLQHRIQEYYFYFQVVFIMLVTAVGSSLAATIKVLSEKPLYIFQLLATTLPFSTHFYLNFIPLQWVTHVQGTLRIVQLFKFKSFSVMYDETVAKRMSEPEDQDYYGIGSRSARQSFFVALCLVFCSLSPLILPLGFINCLICRLVYGYLVTFAESKKPDLGGPFWVTQLTQVMQSMFLYIILMVGVLMVRSSTKWPSVIAALSFVYMFVAYYRFSRAFQWETLSLNEMQAFAGDDGGTATATRSTYEQPELSDSYEGDQFGARMSRKNSRRQSG